MVRTPAITILAVLLAGCASAPPAAQSSSDADAAAQRPLERLAGQPLVVLPTQYLSFGDSLGWRASVTRRTEYLAGLDDEIGFELGERGLSRKWTFARAITRAARSNSPMVPDPHALSAESVRGRVTVEETLKEPLGSQIRSLVALKDGRFALLPVELKTLSANGTGVAVLKVVLIDARLAKIKWIGEVRSARMRDFSPALAASVASRLADLIAP